MPLPHKRLMHYVDHWNGVVERRLLEHTVTEIENVSRLAAGLVQDIFCLTTGFVPAGGARVR